VKRAGRFAPGLETAAMLGLGLAAIYAELAPFSLAAERPPAPDLVYCLVAAWVVRRPAAAPLWAILALGLAGDLLLSRPLGLGALGLMLGAEALRSNAALVRGGPFAVEWVAACAVFALMLAGLHLALQVAFLDGPGLWALGRYAGTTALAYPAAAALLTFGLGMRAPRRAAASDRLGRIA
jgi:rod shape-determining protein MreD